MGKILVGVAGWSYPDWEGAVYPRPKPRGFDPLSYLAGFLDVIEINSTFYHPGPEKNARSWARRVQDFPDFKFTVKAWQRLTHEREEFGRSEVEAARLVPQILAESGKLGAVLVQFPWSFQNTGSNREWLKRVAEVFRGLPLAVEVRHDSWESEEFRAELRRRDAALVNLDQPLIGRSIAPGATVTSNRAYLRLHGRNYQDWFREDAGRDARYNYLYTTQELAPWKERVLQMAAAAEEVYVVANNHYQGRAAANAVQLKRLLGGQVEVPGALARSFPFLARGEED